MSEQEFTPKPPYVPFGTFKNFIEKFREQGLPDVIDKSLMQNYSGTIQSMLIKALRSMGFIDEVGVPTQRFHSYISGSVAEQREALLNGLKSCYPVVFSHTTSPIKMTQGQFDKALRDEFKFTASTLDKAASFFLAACAESGFEVSDHLQKRKATATRKRKEKSEKNENSTPDRERNGHSRDEGEILNDTTKPLPYQLLDLLKEPDFAEEHKKAVWELVQYLMERQKK